MTNPRENIRVYLKRLLDRFFYIKSLHNQLILLKEWESPERSKAIDVGYYFFGLVSYSFQRTILIELCMLLSDREDKSLVDFLTFAEQHADSIEPKQYDMRSNQDCPVNPTDFTRIVLTHKTLLAGKQDLIRRIKAQRDKFLVHADEAFFDDPTHIYSQYPIDESEIGEVVAIVSEILKSFYLYLFSTDRDMEIYSGSGIDAVLSNVRAFDRIWMDKRLSNLKRYLYREDDYDETVPVFFN